MWTRKLYKQTSKRLHGIKISKQLYIVMLTLNGTFDNPKLDIPNTRLDTIIKWICCYISINRICKNIIHITQQRNCIVVYKTSILYVSMSYRMYPMGENVQLRSKTMSVLLKDPELSSGIKLLSIVQRHHHQCREEEGKCWRKVPDVVWIVKP